VGCGGERSDALGERTLEAHHVLVRGDGTIELVGVARKGSIDEWCEDEGNASEFAVARLDDSGRLAGETSIPQDRIEGCAEDLRHAAYDEEGRLVFNGSFSEWPGFLPGEDGGPKQSDVVARLRPDGSFDESYDGDGVAVNPDETLDGVGLARVRTPDGGVVFLEERDPYEGGVLLSKVGKDGEAVRGFGSLVRGIPRETDLTQYSIWDLALDRRRGIYGFARFLKRVESGDLLHILFRHRLRDGKPDPAFGREGTVDATPRGARVWSGYDFVLQPDGKPVVSGVVERGRRLRLFAARYTAGGEVDSSFGRAGLAEFDVGRSFGDDRDWRSAVALDPEGRIVMSGFLRGRGASVFRMWPDGRVDTSFGVRGRVLVPRL
jgi:uncharacterized delta-60 repeat protein